jgi:hypothetical protein
VIEAIFWDLVKDLIAERMYHRIRRGFTALVAQEIATTEMGGRALVLFGRALDHLQNTGTEPQGLPGESRHIESARLAFVETVRDNNSLVAARAAFYAGLCHRLRDERQELKWYVRSLEIILGFEARIFQRAVNQSLPLAGFSARSDSPILDLPALFAVSCVPCLRKNLQVQRQTVREHKEAVADVIKRVQRTGRLGFCANAHSGRLI